MKMLSPKPKLFEKEQIPEIADQGCVKLHFSDNSTGLKQAFQHCMSKNLWGHGDENARFPASNASHS